MEESHRPRHEIMRSETAPPRFLHVASAQHTSETREHVTSGTSSGAVSIPTPAARVPPSNLELLMSTSPEALHTSSRAPLFDGPEDAKFDAALEAQSQRMEAIQAALTDIIALDKHENPLGDVHSEGGSLSNSMVLPEEAKGEYSFDEDADAEDRTAERTETHGSFQLAGPGSPIISKAKSSQFRRMN